MTYSISYTSKTERVTISASGETMVGALAKMVEVFGEGFTALYEHTHQELLQITETIESERRPAPVQEKEDEPNGFDTFLGRDVPDPDVPVPQTGGEPAGEAAGSEAGGGPTCVICGTSVTTDRAIASEIELDEVRCAECSP